MNSNETDQNWLEKMQGLLTWSLKGPDLDNPYASPVSDTQLIAMIENFEVLKEYLTVRCTCDGSQVLIIKNLANPTVKTEHPCVNSLSAQEILRAADRIGVPKMIIEQASRVREVLVRELRERQRFKKTVQADNSGKTIAEIRKQHEAHQQAAKTSIQSSVIIAPDAIDFKLAK